MGIDSARKKAAELWWELLGMCERGCLSPNLMLNHEVKNWKGFAVLGSGLSRMREGRGGREDALWHEWVQVHEAILLYGRIIPVFALQVKKGLSCLAQGICKLKKSAICACFCCFADWFPSLFFCPFSRISSIRWRQRLGFVQTTANGGAKNFFGGLNNGGLVGLRRRLAPCLFWLLFILGSDVNECCSAW